MQCISLSITARFGAPASGLAILPRCNAIKQQMEARVALNASVRGRCKKDAAVIESRKVEDRPGEKWWLRVSLFRALWFRERFLYPSPDQCKKNCSVQRSTYLGSSPRMLGSARQTVPLKKKGYKSFKSPRALYSESLSQGFVVSVLEASLKHKTGGRVQFIPQAQVIGRLRQQFWLQGWYNFNL